MSRPLSSFTPAELDALPVGARFEDRKPWPLRPYVKHPDGRWGYGDEPRHLTGEALAAAARDGHVYGTRVLDLPDPAAELARLRTANATSRAALLLAREFVKANLLRASGSIAVLDAIDAALATKEPTP